MIGLLRTLVILAIIYLIFRFITRVILPLVLGHYINNKVSQAQRYQQNETTRREGDVTINYSSDKNKKHKEKEGEYVDFEEIKE